MVHLSLEFVTLGLAALAQLSIAHPGEADEVVHPADLEATKRHVQARNCAPQIAAHVAARKAKRALAGKPNMRRWGPDSVPQGTELWRRTLHPRQASSREDTVISSTDDPKYGSIQNSTCVTAPEVTEGPYYVNNELVRNDTQPLANPLVKRSSKSGLATFTLPPSTATTITTDVSSTTTTRGPPTGGPGGPSQNMTDQLTFLRGGAPTNENGILEFKTIYPGFYTGRTIHIHAMIQTNYTVFSNGVISTIGSKQGDVHHIGQIFFDESLNDQVLAQPAYQNTTQIRTLNTQDGFIQGANADGYNSFADAELLGDKVEDGVLAYITIGIDPTRHVNITSTNYASTILWGSSSPLPTATNATYMI
ncbi:intradiol ring-cleavage dioxygenase [Ceratobasidium sp. AG-Ba]|nr:intradiol ring-cleavage dioxygenase [Ceratobasidium sp. AG-Ba]QRW01925.1 hypothetical protein RhiLY_00922 [Ceratobasidium sp. AG-Ba]